MCFISIEVIWWLIVTNFKDFILVTDSLFNKYNVLYFIQYK